MNNMIGLRIATEKATHCELREFVAAFPRRCNHLSDVAMKRCHHLLFQAGVDVTSITGSLLVKVTHRVKDCGEISELVLIQSQGDISWNLTVSTELKMHENEVIKKLRSPKKGVSIHASVKMWRARRKLGNVCKHLGYHASDLAASMSYLMASNSVTSRDIGTIRVLTNDPSVISTLEKVIDLSEQRVIFKNGIRNLGIETEILTLQTGEEPWEFDSSGSEFSSMSFNSSFQDDIDLAIKWTFGND